MQGSGTPEGHKLKVTYSKGGSSVALHRGTPWLGMLLSAFGLEVECSGCVKLDNL